MIDFSKTPETVNDARLFSNLKALCMHNLVALADNDDLDTDAWFDNVESCVDLYSKLDKGTRPTVTKQLIQQLLKEELRSRKIDAGYIKYLISICK